MRWNKIVATCLAVLLLGLGSARAELVVNGTFSDINDPFTGWTASGNTGNYYGPGVLWGEDPLGAALGANSSPLFLSQDIATTIGNLYRFTFNVKGYDASFDPPNAIAYFRADVGGLTVLNAALDLPVWQTVSVLFSATSAITSIVFESQNDWAYYHLDQVSFLPAASTVPEPAGLALILTATILSALALSIRRRA